MNNFVYHVVEPYIVYKSDKPKETPIDDADHDSTVHKPKIMAPDMPEPIEISVKTVGFVCKFVFDLAKL